MKLKFTKFILVFLLSFCIIGNDILPAFAVGQEQATATVESYRFRDRQAIVEANGNDESILNDYVAGPEEEIEKPTAPYRRPFYRSKVMNITNNAPIQVPIVGTNDFFIKAVDIYGLDNKRTYTKIFEDYTSNEDAIKDFVNQIKAGYKVQIYYQATTSDEKEDVTFYDYHIIEEKTETITNTTPENLNYQIGEIISFTVDVSTDSNGIAVPGRYEKVKQVGNSGSGYQFVDLNGNLVAGLNDPAGGSDLILDAKSVIKDVVYKDVTYPTVNVVGNVNKWNAFSISYTKTESTDVTGNYIFNSGVNQFDDTLQFGQIGFTDKTLPRTSAGNGQNVDANINNAAESADATHAVFFDLFNDIIRNPSKNPGYFTNENTDWKTVYSSKDNFELEFYRDGHRHILKTAIDNQVEGIETDSKIAFRDPKIIESITPLPWETLTNEENRVNNDLFYANLTRNFFPLNDVDYPDTFDEVKKAVDYNRTADYINLSLTQYNTSGNNCFFGMKYAFDFSVGDYIGPMIFGFVGDDDLWVTIKPKNGNFEDGTTEKVILDMGGLHQAYPTTYVKNNQSDSIVHAPSSVDIRKYFKENNLDFEQDQYTITVYYMERGGWESSCYMDYVLPNATPVTVDPIEPAKLGNIEFTKVSNILVGNEKQPLEGANFGLYASEEDAKNDINRIGSPVVSSSNGLVAFSNLVVGDYYIKEISAPDGYEKDNQIYMATVVAGQTVSLKKMDGTDVTQVENKLNNPDIEIKGTKTWIGVSEENRPTEIEVGLFQNNGNTPIKVEKVTQKDNWTYSFGKWPTYDSDGVPYVYTVKEISMNGEKVTYENGKGTCGDFEVSHRGFNVENKLVDPKTEVTIKKTWKDNENAFGLRPDSITIELYANGKKADAQLVTGGSNDNTWTYTFENLDKYDVDGKEIVYTVKETDVHNYQASVVGYEITNEIQTKKVSGVKTWGEGINVDQVRSITVVLLKDKVEYARKTVTADDNWSYSFENLPISDKNGVAYQYTISEVGIDSDVYTLEDFGVLLDGYNLLNTLYPTSVKVTKVWEDNEDALKLRPESITVDLLADGVTVDSKTIFAKDGWQYEFKNLAKFNTDGSEIVYTVVEKDVPNYISSVKGNTITNTLSLISVEGTKTWNDHDDLLELRPESITIRLHANGKEITHKEVTSHDEWKYSFTNLPKYTQNGVEIKYTVTEDQVAHYQTTFNGFNIINTLETVEITINKNWEVPENFDLPNIVIALMNGDQVIEEVTLNGSWTHTFTDLVKYDENNEEIHYTVKEVKIGDEDVVYTVANQGSAGHYTVTIDDYEITNIYNEKKVEYIDVAGTKTWEDANDRYGIRPEQITIRLYANGKEVGSKVVTEKDKWKYSFDQLLKYDVDGKEIVYTISEDQVEGYKTKVKGYDVVNTTIPQTGDNISINLAIKTTLTSGVALLFLLVEKKRKLMCK